MVTDRVLHNLEIVVFNVNTCLKNSQRSTDPVTDWYFYPYSDCKDLISLVPENDKGFCTDTNICNGSMGSNSTCKGPYQPINDRGCDHYCNGTGKQFYAGPLLGCIGDKGCDGIKISEYEKKLCNNKTSQRQPHIISETNE